MIAYKCKCCGSGELEPLGDGRKAMCNYCNTVMVLPTLHPEAYNQANELRKRCDFDQAVMAFERIVSENPNDCESYWNLVLSRYGIEYVKDGEEDDEYAPYVPTCHRMSYTSILDDPDYQKALDCADGFSYRLYQGEAEKIDRILKRAANIAHSQKPYDIFISYKETDKNGDRTEDSTIAQNVYDALKEKHPELKIFLSRITLKEVGAGLEYEPIIFSALNTAKLMIVVGTNRENLEATWVKNEWSRYRKMMNTDKNKHMAVVYKKGMEPSKDFPNELRLFSIQATEASGFYLQDFVMGVEELLGIKAQPVIDSEKIYKTTSSRQVDNLLIRAQQALEIGNKEEARGFLEKALGLDAQCARAWWGLFEMETDNLRYIDEKKEFTLNMNAQNNWRMVERYAEGAEREEFMSAYADYKARWEEAYLARENRLQKEANKKKVAEAIEEIKKETQDGKYFGAYNKYGPEAKYIKELFSIADGRDKEWITTFEASYEENHKKFMELQDVKATDPVAQIKSTSKYKELFDAKENANDAVIKAARGMNGVGIGSVVLGILIAVLTFFANLGNEYAVELLPITAHVVPLAAAFYLSYSLLRILRIGKPDKRLIIAMFPTIIGYLAIQYYFVSEAKKLYPEISIASIFCGFIFVAALVIVVIFIFLIFVAGIWGAVGFLIIGYIIAAILGGLLGGLSGVLGGELVLLEAEHLMPTKGIVFTVLLLALVAVTVLTVLRYVKNKAARAIYDSKNAVYKEARTQFDNYYDDELEKFRAPFRNYVAVSYLDDMSKRDI